MKKKDKKIMEDIQKRANAKFGDKLFKLQPKADAMLEVLDKALTTDKDKFDELTLNKLQTIKDSQLLEGDEKVVDDEVAKKMDKFIADEITKAIESGALSHPDKDPLLRKVKQLQRKHERRNTKSEGGSDSSTEGSSS